MINFNNRPDTLARYFLYITVVLALSFAFAMKLLAAPVSGRDKINYLLHEIESSNVVFVCHGKEYTGSEARVHLQKKLDLAGEKIRTAEDFITYIATKSSMDGTTYYVKLKDGKQIATVDWLREKLRLYEKPDNMEN